MNSNEVKEKEVQEEQIPATEAEKDAVAALTAENEALIAENEKLTEENAKLKKTADRLQSSADNSDKFRDQLVALKADFDSYKRRMKNDAEASAAQGRKEVIESVLPVLDNLDRAKEHLSGDNLKAFEMVSAQLTGALQSLGVEILEVAGEDFDPDTMNALSIMECGEDKIGKVVEVYKKGYTYCGKVLRYAEVIVGK